MFGSQIDFSWFFLYLHFLKIKMLNHFSFGCDHVTVSTILSIKELCFGKDMDLVSDAHLGVKLQPLGSDGGEGDMLSTQSHSVHNLLMLQWLHWLSIDLQQYLSIPHTRPLCRTATVHLTQDMSCYSTIHRCLSQRLKSSMLVLDFCARFVLSHVRPDGAFSSRRKKP